MRTSTWSTTTSSRLPQLANGRLPIRPSTGIEGTTRRSQYCLSDDAFPAFRIGIGDYLWVRSSALIRRSGRSGIHDHTGSDSGGHAGRVKVASLELVYRIPVGV
jgi:hypothetical protein